MTAKEYLSQARFLDLRINAKIQQVSALNELATRATSTLTGMPRCPSPAASSMAEAVDRIIDLQTEINHDIDDLVDLKQQISGTIKAVEDPELQTILEKRYLCFQSWEEIAASMNYAIRHLHRLHGNALEEVKSILGIE